VKLSVASVTTAYNAEEFLPRQIESLLKQSRPLQEIIVVDNRSTDGTAVMLAERFPQVTVLRQQENLGAAGGWAAGLQYTALEKKHDWIWNFDGDSVPSEFALESLLTGAEDLAADPRVGMLAPLPTHEETGTIYPPWLWKDGFVRPPDELLMRASWFADLVITSGCMIRREVIEAIGLPRADFFMDFADFEYCFRIRSHGYKIAVLNQCRMAHELGNTKTVSLAGRSRVWSEHAPWREYYVSRNITYMAKSLYSEPGTRRGLAFYLVRHAAAVLLRGSRKMSSLWKILQGVWDGLCGRLGIRFLPQESV
jgi:GT2 family glycosyltransferase